MDNLSRSHSQAEDTNSPKQLSYSRLGAEVDQEECQKNTKSRSQNKKLLELPQKPTSKIIENKCQKIVDFITTDGPNVKISYSYSLSKPTDLDTFNSHQESKEQPCSHSMMTRSGMEKHKQALKAIIEKRQEDELGSSEKSVLTSQIMKKISIQNPCHSTYVHQQNKKDKKINHAQSLTHRTASHFQNKNVMIRAIDDSIQYDIDEEAELIQTSDRFTLSILPAVKQEGTATNDVYRQVAMLASLTTQSKKYGNKDEMKKSKQKIQQVYKKTYKQEQGEILQKIKNLQTMVRQLKQKREMIQRQDCIQKKQVTKKLEEEIAQIKRRLSKLQNHQSNFSQLNVQRSFKTHQLPKFEINFLEQLLRDKIWQKFYLLNKLQIEQKSVTLSQIFRSLNMDIQLKIVEQKNQIVALCQNQRKLSVIATKSQLYYGPYVYLQQKYIKKGYGLSFIPKTQAYLGNFNKNVRQGKGLLITIQREIYQGEFFNDLKHGYGKHLFANGDVYQGNYQENKFHGDGLYIWKNGDFYQGQFKKGKMDGRGRWWSRNGDEYEGEYKNGLKQGWGIYTYASGKKIEGQFAKGKKIKVKTKYQIEKRQITSQHNFCRSYSSTKPIRIFHLNHNKNKRSKQIGFSAQRFRVSIN